MAIMIEERAVPGFSTIFGVAAVAGILALACDDWIAGFAIIVLWGAWTFLPTTDGPPVLALALTWHWNQIVIGIYYFALTGRPLTAMVLSDYRPMVLIGLGCMVALIFGLRVGSMLIKDKPLTSNVEYAMSSQFLLVFYAAAVVLKAPIQAYAWTVPALNQGLLALTYLRLILFYIVLRRLFFAGLWGRGLALLLVEVVLGFAGYFAEFREPLFIAAIVFSEQFDRRKARHWAAATGLLCVCLFTGLLWMGVRGTMRGRVAEGTAGTSTQERLSLIGSLTQSWFKGDQHDQLENADAFVDRLWDVYYPALAMARIPSVMPYEDGAILIKALQHIAQPRLLFPDKKELESDSLLVRKYSGVFVAGPEQNTSIAFGYAIESYIDFGIPLMFVPVFFFGTFMGASFKWLATNIKHREIAIAVLTVIFWLALSPFNRAWARTLGMSGTLLIYLGGAGYLVDRYLSMGGAPPAIDDTVDDFAAQSAWQAPERF
jgi:hypothetical protein